MSNRPQVSVNMVVYNGAEYLQAAIESVVCQSFLDWELIVVDNGSTDGTGSIIRSFSGDERIRPYFFDNPDLIGSRNFALEKSRGEYIGVLDSDDVCHPDRLFHQVNYLNHHSNISLVGSYTQVIDENNKRSVIHRHPSSSYMIKWRLFFGTPFAHSAIMFRKTIGAKYNEDFKWSCDKELYVKQFDQIEFANIESPLVQFRVHKGNQENPDKTAAQTRNGIKLSRIINSSYLGLTFDEEVYRTVARCRIYKVHNKGESRILLEYLLRVKEEYKKRYARSDRQQEYVDQEAKKLWLGWHIGENRSLIMKVRTYLSVPSLIDANNLYKFLVHCLRSIVS